MNRSKPRLIPSSARTSLTNVVRLPRRWWRLYADWRIVLTIATALAFLAIVVVPTGVAVAFKQPRTQPSIEAWLHAADEKTSIAVYQMQTGSVLHMPLGEYVMDVLAAELPPTTPMSALQAAAITARTYAVRSMAIAPAQSLAQRHGAAVTDSGSLDLPVQTEAQQAVRFGTQLNAALARYQAAILATDGQILTYQDKPILAFSFALSPGRTQSAAAVFQQPIAYLPSVPCPDDALVAAQPVQYFDTATLAARLHIQLTRGALASFVVLGRNVAGFVESVHGPASSQWTGAAFAQALGLQSGDFAVAVDKGKLAVTCQGVGADVGLSLHEAVAMSSAGKTARQVLATFYPGAQIDADTRFVG